MDRYINWQFLAKGGDATVFKAYDNIRNKWVAIKQYKYIPLTLLRETSLLKKINCKYIIRLLDVFNYNEFIYIVMKLSGQNILEHIYNPIYENIDKNKIMIQLIESINYLHSIGYIH